MSKIITINNRRIEPGESKDFILNTYRLPTRTLMEIPVRAIRGQKEGPVILFSSGLHGDEVNGIEIIRQLLKGNYFNKIKKGAILAIPVINIISFLNRSRELPDGKDLNRCFPGSRIGSLGSRIAYDLMNEIIPQVDYGVDFHTGGAKINNYPQLRCNFENKQALELAQMFSAPFIVNSPYREKSFRCEAEKLGKPILVYEAGESHRFNKLAITEGINGCLRLLQKLDMLDAELPTSQSHILNNNTWIRAKIAGLFRTSKKYGSYVKKYEHLGSISDPYGTEEVDLISPEDGFILGINNMPVINEGDALIHIGMK